MKSTDTSSRVLPAMFAILLIILAGAGVKAARDIASLADRERAKNWYGWTDVAL